VGANLDVLLLSKDHLMRLPRRLAMLVTGLSLVVTLSGVVPVGVRQAKPAAGHYSLVQTVLDGVGAIARPAAGGRPGSRGALALVAPPSAPPTTGWSTRIETPDQPLMVGLSWRGRNEGELQLRTSDGTTFGNWVDVDGTPVVGPDANDPNRGHDLTSTDAVWVGEGVREVEVRVTKGSLRGLKLTQFKWQGALPSAGSAGVGAEGAGAEPANPGIHLRGEWDGGQGWQYGTAGCQDGPKVPPALQMAIVHHTVNANDYTQAQVPLLINGIYQWHTGNNGWCDIAYNFLADRFGGLWQGRSGDISSPVWGGHAIGFNWQTMGVALLGSFQPGGSPGAVQPSLAMINSLENLIAWKFAIHGIDPKGATQYRAGAGSYWADGTMVNINTIVGHRDTSSTECPGDLVESLMPTIRQAVADRIAAAPALPPDRVAPFASDRQLVSQQVSDAMFRTATNSDQAYWIDKMVSYGMSGPGVLSALLASPDYQNVSLPVLRLYFAVFARWADYGGLGFWSNWIRGGRSVVDVANNMAASPEFQATYGNTTNKQFVDLLYQHVLGRAADPSGETYWVGRLDSGLSRGDVVYNFSESPENVTRQTDNTNVGQVYEAMLHRAPDPQGFIWAAGLYQQQGRLALVSAVWGSPEYQSRFH